MICWIANSFWFIKMYTLPKVILQGTVEGKRRRGKPKISWGDYFVTRFLPSLNKAYTYIHHDAPLRLLAELRDQGKAILLSQYGNSLYSGMNVRSTCHSSKAHGFVFNSRDISTGTSRHLSSVNTWLVPGKLFLFCRLVGRFWHG